MSLVLVCCERLARGSSEEYNLLCSRHFRLDRCSCVNLFTRLLLFVDLESLASDRVEIILIRTSVPASTKQHMRRSFWSNIWYLVSSSRKRIRTDLAFSAHNFSPNVSSLHKVYTPRRLGKHLFLHFAGTQRRGGPSPNKQSR